MIKNWKRLISALLTIAILTAGTGTAFAAEASADIPLSVSSTSCTAGDTATVDISISDTAVASYEVQLTYDSAYLTPTGVTTQLDGDLDYNTDSPGSITVTFTAADAAAGVSGTLFSVAFSSSASAQGSASVEASGTASLPDSSSAALTSGSGVITFEAPEPTGYTVIFNIAEGGTATTDKQVYSQGETVNIMATPDSGYTFSGWSSGNAVINDTSSAVTSFEMPARNVTVSAHFSKIPVDESKSIVLSDVTGGKITSSASSATAGTQVTLTATPDDGYYFKSWRVQSGGVSILSETAPLTYFDMKNLDVTISAEFAKVPTGSYSVTVYSDNGIRVSGTAQYYSAGSIVSLDAKDSLNYYFDYWSSSDSQVSFANESSAQTTFVMPARNVVVYANYSHDAVKRYHLVIQVEGMGVANTYTGLYDFEEGEKVTITATPSYGYYFYGWSSLNSGVSFLNASNSTTSFTMPARDVTIKAMFASSTGNTTTGTVASGGVYGPTSNEFIVSFNTGGGTAIGTVTVASGQTVARPAVDPQLAGFTFAGWYADTAYTTVFNFAQPIYMHTTIYAKWISDSAAGQIFSDVNSADWFCDYVISLYSKNIIGGMGNGRFAPHSNITRAQFVTILANVAGANLSAYGTSEFSDVKATDWYAKQIAWAKSAGIAGGSNGKFSPNAPISRQDMAVMIKRYVDYKSATLSTTSSTADFADSAKIAAYAKDAVKAMQGAGIIGGKNGNIFDPTANATRAEACKMIHVLLSNIG